MKQKENGGADPYDCSFAKKRGCVLIAPQGPHESAKRNKILGDCDMAKFRTAMAAVAMAALLIGSQAMAADATMLAPGKPSGVEAARHTSHRLLLIGGAAAVVVLGIAIGIVTSNNPQCTTACAVSSTGT
jgi:hypothetical protein